MKIGPKISRHSGGKLYTTLTVLGKKNFIYGDTEEEVQARYLELKYMHSQGYNISENPTVEEYAIRWYNTFKKHRTGKGGAVKTKKMYINAVEVHIIPAIGKKHVKDVTPSDIQALLNASSSSKSLQHKVRITLNQIFTKAIADRLIAFNPVTGTEPVETDDPIRLVYTPEQRAILIDVLKDLSIFPLVFTVLNTGIRATEALALMRTRDLDLDDKKIYVRESTEFIHGRPQKKPTKTKRGVRPVPIPSAFADWLSDYLKTVKSLYVFPGPGGGQMGETKLTNMQRKANQWLARWFDKHPDQEEHRFKLHFRTLRHTYCTELFDLGIDEVSAAAIMGHTVTVMREIYTHIQKGRQVQTVERIEKLYQNVTELPLEKSCEKV